MIDEVFGAVAVGVSRIDRGLIVEVQGDGILVALDGLLEPLCCQVLQTTGADSPVLLAARDSVLVFHNGREGEEGVILGRVGASHAQTEPAVADSPEELVIEAAKNLTLKCGEGSITMRDDGRILIKGKDLVSHAQRMNRIRGGSVSIN